MLVGRTEGFNRRRTNKNFIACKVIGLAQTFRPQLTVPIRKIFQRIRIRHHHRNRLASIIIVPVDRSIDRGGIGKEIFLAAQLIHLCRPGQQFVNINAAYGRTQQPYRTEYAEPTAHTIRHHQCPQFRIVRNLPHRTGIGIGRRNHLFPEAVFAEFFQQKLADHKKLCRCLGSTAGLADHVEDRLVQLVANPVEKTANLHRIDVIKYKQPRPFALVSVHIVHVRIQRSLDSDVAQCRTADTQHDEIFATGYFSSHGLHRSRIVGIIRQIPIRNHPVFSLLIALGNRRNRLLSQFFKLLLRDTVLFADDFGGYVFVIQCYF